MPGIGPSKDFVKMASENMKKGGKFSPGGGKGKMMKNKKMSGGLFPAKKMGM